MTRYVPTAVALSPPAMMFAQGVAGGTSGIDAIAGGAGWLGAGIFGFVLAWLLLKHLPAKDAQMERLVAAKDAAVQGIMESHRGVISDMIKAHGEDMAQMQTQFHVSLQLVVDRFEKFGRGKPPTI